jgi:YfiH family protein
VLVHDPWRRVVAAIHAGWRGAVAGIVPKTFTLMADRFGSARSDLRVSIGPSVGPCCYEVDAPVLDQLRIGLPDWETVVHDYDYHRHKARLDLKALIRLQAKGAGVSASFVSAVNLCTICHDELFYSYRREVRVNGTMVSGISLLSHR